MKKILAIAQKEFTASFKDKVFLLMAGLFLLMSIVSVYVGATTKNAEWSAYQSIVQAAVAQGLAAPAAPEIFPLTILHNMTEYIVMIGAVLAIFIGFDGFSGERDSGTLGLVLTKPITRAGFITGKLLGAGFIIGAPLLVTLTFNIALFIVFSGFVPNMDEVMRLAVFVVTAFCYMMLFYAAALFVSVQSRDRTYSFLIMMAIWIFISFVVPQLADTQRSFSYAVNNVAGMVTQVPADTSISRMIDLFSPAVQFQKIGDDLLQAATESATLGIFRLAGKDFLQFLYLIGLGGVLCAFTFSASKKERVL